MGGGVVFVGRSARGVTQAMNGQGEVVDGW